MNWLETPRGLAVVLGVVVIFSSVFGFWTGFSIARDQQRAQQYQIIFPPGTVITIPQVEQPQR